jgi:hypothetical protein
MLATVAIHTARNSRGDGGGQSLVRASTAQVRNEDVVSTVAGDWIGMSEHAATTHDTTNNRHVITEHLKRDRVVDIVIGMVDVSCVGKRATSRGKHARDEWYVRQIGTGIARRNKFHSHFHKPLFSPHEPCNQKHGETK